MTKEDEQVVSDLEKQVEALTEQLTKAIETNEAILKAGKKKPAEGSKEEEDAETAEEEAKEQAAMKKAVADLTAANAELVKVATLTDVEKAFCKDMAAVEKAKFLDMKTEDRTKVIAKATQGDETVKVGDREIRKSVVGADQFAVIKLQQEQIDKSSKDLAIEKDAREMAVLEKRADDEFKHVPGTPTERAKMLKVVAAQPEEIKKAFEAVFTQSEKLAKSAFEKVGNKGGVDDLQKAKTNNGISDFEKKVDEIHKRDKGTKGEAMTKARNEYPKEFADYNKSAN